jgi:hypothetical protein
MHKVYRIGNARVIFDGSIDPGARIGALGGYADVWEHGAGKRVLDVTAFCAILGREWRGRVRIGTVGQ